ncbi:linoleate 13s-lipoxygenase 2-1 [Quercus suber]|uniref:Linoleate 13s-lipoxygenase 2-1 n=1 Tax=Quercus suber TaxID=58331 RepID=A0AAW0LFA2_QUESU
MINGYEHPLSEQRSSSVYVPRDEAFSEVKQLTFSAKTLKSVMHALLPQLEISLLDPHLGFPHFTAIDSLFCEGLTLPKPTNAGFFQDEEFFAWFRDEEFSRQTLAGLNPCSIQLVTDWPMKSKLDPKIYGPLETLITTELVEQEIRGIMTVNEALKSKRLLVLDYHDLLLPYVNKVREVEGTTLYGSRALVFLTKDGTLRPVAIELARPPTGDKPQWKYTMEINALARESLINAGGIIESAFSPAKYSIEFSSATYNQLWRFDMEVLPADLIRSDYVNHYYPEPSLVQSDGELQAWWTEVRTKGHADKKDEPWWPVLKTPENLIHILTTITWVTAGHHAAVNFGQYMFAGYFPNRSTIA